LSINEHPQTLNAITKGKRNLNTALALKIEEKLGLEEGSLAILQTYYDIRKEKEKQVQETPDLSKLRKALFWDTDFNKINWQEKVRLLLKECLNVETKLRRKKSLVFMGRTK
jgi:antitoxin HigA-1